MKTNRKFNSVQQRGSGVEIKKMFLGQKKRKTFLMAYFLFSTFDPPISSKKKTFYTVKKKKKKEKEIPFSKPTGKYVGRIRPEETEIRK